MNISIFQVYKQLLFLENKTSMLKQTQYHMMQVNGNFKQELVMT